MNTTTTPVTVLDPSRVAVLGRFTLERGVHPRPAEGLPPAPDGMCLMEAVAYVAGEPWSDHPRCVSPLLAAYGRTLNDVLDDDARQALRPYVTRLVGTRDDGHDAERAMRAMRWLIGDCLPMWLVLAGDADAAARARMIARFPLVDMLAAIRELRSSLYTDLPPWSGPPTMLVHLTAGPAICGAGAATAVLGVEGYSLRITTDAVIGEAIMRACGTGLAPGVVPATVAHAQAGMSELFPYLIDPTRKD